MSRAICTWTVVGARRRRGDLGLPARVDQHALGDLPVGPEVVQLPAQLVDQPGPGVHEPFAMQRQQPDLELGAGEPGGRERLDALSQRGACDRERVDRIRLPALADPWRASAINRGGRRTTVSPRSIKNRSSAAGDVADVLEHPHPLCVELARPLQQLTEPLTPGSDRALRDLHARAGRPRPPCASACADRPRSSTSDPSLHRMNPMKRTPGGHYSVGALPSSYQVTPGRP